MSTWRVWSLRVYTWRCGRFVTTACQVLQHAERPWRYVFTGVAYRRLVVVADLSRRVVCNHQQHTTVACLYIYIYIYVNPATHGPTLTADIDGRQCWPCRQCRPTMCRGLKLRARLSYCWSALRWYKLTTSVRPSVCDPSRAANGLYSKVIVDLSQIAAKCATASRTSTILSHTPAITARSRIRDHAMCLFTRPAFVVYPLRLPT